MSETLGETARRAWMDCESSDYWEVTASAVKVAVLEEAIEALQEEITQITPASMFVDDSLSAAISVLQRLMDQSLGVMQTDQQADETVSPDKPALQTDSVRETE